MENTTKSKITPFLWFNGNIEEAIELYTSVFKNTKVGGLQRMGDGKIVTATFELEGQKFMALDGGPMYSFTPAVSMFVNCETQEEVDELWDKLLVGGRADRCGWLVDKFGLSWQIIPTALGRLMHTPDPIKSKRVMDAMLKMNKIIIKDLQAAYDGE